jgi:hypothetical protein
MYSVGFCVSHLGAAEEGGLLGYAYREALWLPTVIYGRQGSRVTKRGGGV